MKKIMLAGVALLFSTAIYAQCADGGLTKFEYNLDTKSYVKVCDVVNNNNKTTASKVYVCNKNQNSNSNNNNSANDCKVIYQSAPVYHGWGSVENK